MGFFKRVLANVLLNKDHKDALYAFALLIKECKGVSSAYECQEAMKKVGRYVETIRDEKYNNLRGMCGDLIEFLSDTRYHASHLYHKPRHNGWKTVRTFPDINDYINIGEKI